MVRQLPKRVEKSLRVLTGDAENKIIGPSWPPPYALKKLKWKTKQNKQSKKQKEIKFRHGSITNVIKTLQNKNILKIIDTKRLSKSLNRPYY